MSSLWTDPSSRRRKWEGRAFENVLFLCVLLRYIFIITLLLKVSGYNIHCKHKNTENLHFMVGIHNSLVINGSGDLLLYLLLQFRMINYFYEMLFCETSQMFFGSSLQNVKCLLSWL